MSEAREWDALADTFDEEADHGLRDPEVRDAWRSLLLEAMPPTPARVADLGCGTGTLSLLLAEEGYAVVLCRHVLWALPDPDAALGRWLDLLTPTGRLVLIEGSWHTGAGHTAEETVSLLVARGRAPTVRHLAEGAYWGGEISDERYLVVS